MVLPFLVAYSLGVRFYSPQSTRIFLGLMANNNLVYVRDALRKIGYTAALIPWIIPDHERKHISYDLDLKLLYPRLYKNFIGQIILNYFFFIWVITKFDIFIVPFQNRLLDRSVVLKWLEFQLLHLAKKKIILNPYGGDIQYIEVWEGSTDPARQELYKAWKSDPYYGTYARACFVLRNTQYCLNHADAVVLSLEWPDYVPKPLRQNTVEYFHMRAFPSLKIQSSPQKSAGPFKIVHATNHPHFKGTKFLEQAVAEINKNQKLCELVILQHQKNTDVLREIETADLVFDQVLLGAYGRLAIEAMSLGKPVICYLREDLKELYPSWNQCPIINANISTLKSKILEIMNMSPTQRNQIGCQSKAYVEKYHSPDYVGAKLHTLVQKVLNT